MIKLSRSQNPPPSFTAEQAAYIKGLVADIYDELNFAGGISPNVPNLLANPAFRYWWEGVAGAVTGNAHMGIIPFVMTSGGAVTVSREANVFDLPTTSPWVGKISHTAMTGWCGTRFPAEGYFAKKKVTFTFYAKSNSAKKDIYIKAGVIGGGVSVTGDDARWKNKGTEIVTITDQFQQYSVTFDIPEISGVTNVNPAVFFDVFTAASNISMGASEIWYGPCGIYLSPVSVPYVDPDPMHEAQFIMRYYECSWANYEGLQKMISGAGLFLSGPDANDGFHYSTIQYMANKRTPGIPLVYNDQTGYSSNVRVYSQAYVGNASAAADGFTNSYFAFHTFTYSVRQVALMCCHYSCDSRIS